MVETKQLKTKPCLMFRKGRCSRHNCSFAHGDAELRRFSRSFNGRQDYGVADLREKIGRRRSPIHRNSPGRDARVDSRVSQGYTTPRLYGKSSDREHRKRQFDVRNDSGRNLRISDSIEDKANDRKVLSSNSKGNSDEQLNHVRREIQILEDHKTRLKMYLEEKDQAVDTLNSRIQELEMQLFKEKDECERIISATKKFIKTHNRHTRLQKELLRSEARLQKLGDQLGSDVIEPGPIEEDTRINIISDGDPIANRVVSPQIEVQNLASSSKKRPRILITEGEGQLKQAATIAEEGSKRKAMRSEKHLRSDVHHDHLYGNKESTVDGNNGRRPVTAEAQNRQGKKMPSYISSEVKFKDSEPGLLFPSTSMAANVVDEVVDIETDGNLDDENFSDKIGQGVADEVHRFPFQLPPPPPLPRNFYSQDPGENENVAVDVDGPEEMVDVDII